MQLIDKKIINYLQSGFPVCERPFLEIAKKLDITEDELTGRIRELLNEGVLSRFGPLFDIERMGGSYSLVAMQVPEEQVDHVVEIINSLPEIAHNYERNHKFNIWFVVALESDTELTHLLHEIEEITGLPVYNMPKLDEYFVGLRFNA